MKNSAEYTLIADKIACLASKIPSTMVVPKDIATEIKLLDIEFVQKKIKNLDLDASLPFIGYKDGEIIDVDDFVESADIHIDVRQSNLVERMDETFVLEAKAASSTRDSVKYFQEMSKIIDLREQIMVHYLAIGYKAIDRKMYLECEIHPQEVISIIGSDWGLDAYIDVRPQDDGCCLYYPRQLEQDLVKLLKENKDSFELRSVESISPCIPGHKDLLDHRKNVKKRQELQANASFNMR